MSFKFAVVSFLTTITLALAGSASAGVVTFESANDVSANGLTTDFGRLQCSTYGISNSGYCRGRASGDWVGYFASTASIAKTGALPFTFNGAYLTAAWNDNMSIQVVGYRNNVVVYTQTKIISDDVATYFAFNYLNVDRVTFRSFGGVDAGTPGAGSWVAMDNVTFNEAIAAVPEPVSLALIGLGLAGLALSRRRTAA